MSGRTGKASARQRRPSATRNSSPNFEGTAPLDACTEKLKQASRNYAKRQLTWFRHMDGVVWLDASAPDAAARAAALTQEFIAKG